MKEHQVTISSQFIRNVKRMWDSPYAAYKEIIQNALRAEAKTIRVTYQENVLTVKDDGKGFSDLKSLLVIGESDWGDEIVEPAGVGIYAAPAFSDHVTLQSGSKVLTLSPTLFETGQVEEHESSETIEGTWVVVEGIDLDKVRQEEYRGFAEVDFYLNGELIPHPLEGMECITTPYGRLYLKHHSKYPQTHYGYHTDIVWEGYALDSKYVSLPGTWVIAPAAVPGELRPQLPHRGRLIKNNAYHEVIKEINDFFNDWALSLLENVDIKALPGKGEFDKVAASLEKTLSLEQISGALVKKAQEHFYTKLSVPILYHPSIDWEGAFGYVDGFEQEVILTRNDLVMEVCLPGEDAEGLFDDLFNTQSEQPVQIKFVASKEKSNFTPINLRKQEGGWYCDGWELDGGLLRGIDVMIWPTEEGTRVVFTGQPNHLAGHVLNNAELWSIVLTCSNYETLSMYWSEDGDGFGVLPGEVLVDAYRAMGQEENDARTYVKIQQVRKVLTDHGLPEAFRELALENLEELEKTFLAAGYTPPENAGPIYLF